MGLRAGGAGAEVKFGYRRVVAAVVDQITIVMHLQIAPRRN